MLLLLQLAHLLMHADVTALVAQVAQVSDVLFTTVDASELNRRGRHPRERSSLLVHACICIMYMHRATVHGACIACMAEWH